MYKEIDSYELKDILKTKDLNLIDIRDNYLYSSGTIKNAKNIPSDYLFMNAENYLNKDNIYYIFCNRGHNSRRICAYLSKKGYKVINILDGYQGYIDSIL